MSCKEYSKLIGDYVNRTLCKESSVKLELHLDSCLHCSSLVISLQNTERLVSSLERTNAPIGFDARLKARLAAERSAKLEHPIKAWARELLHGPAYGYRTVLRPAIAGVCVLMIAAGSLFMSSHNSNTITVKPQIDWGYIQNIRAQHSSFESTDPLADDSVEALAERTQDLGDGYL